MELEIYSSESLVFTGANGKRAKQIPLGKFSINIAEFELEQLYFGKHTLVLYDNSLLYIYV